MCYVDFGYSGALPLSSQSQLPPPHPSVDMRCFPPGYVWMVARGRSPKPLQNTVGPRILHACPSIASGADRTALTATGLSGAPGGRGILGADPVRSSCEEDQSIGPVGARQASSTPFSAAERTLGLDLWRCFGADYSRESPPGGCSDVG